MEWRERDGVRWLEAQLPGATAAFSTRVGGQSREPYDSLNLGLLTGDELGSVRANRVRLLSALGRDLDGVLVGYQAHETVVLRREVAPRPNPFSRTMASPPRSDGQATANPELTPLVQVADCLPLMLVGDEGVAAIHCGWRGMAAGIVDRGVGEVRARAAAIGPGIGRCCYEVGPEVLAEFDELGDGVAEGNKLDLVAVARKLLERAGVTDVEASDLCTKCEPELFYSHRRDGNRSGRQAGAIWADPVDA
jgi:YfiH family protein